MKARCGRCGRVKKLATDGPHKNMLCPDCAGTIAYENAVRNHDQGSLGTDVIRAAESALNQAIIKANPSYLDPTRDPPRLLVRRK